MAQKFVRLGPAQKFYSEKNLLQSQLELLSFHKRYRSYQKLRKEELIYRITLRKKISETLALLKILDKALPKVKLTPKQKALSTELQEDPLESQISSLEDKTSLEQEIDSIKNKLEELSK